MHPSTGRKFGNEGWMHQENKPNHASCEKREKGEEEKLLAVVQRKA